jgi:hypothetical protein
MWTGYGKSVTALFSSCYIGLGKTDRRTLATFGELHDSEVRDVVKCGRESRETQNQEWLRWRVAAAVYMTGRNVRLWLH